MTVNEQSDKDMAEEIVGMYKAIWVEVERQFPTCSSEERLRICSFISPLINNMFAVAMDEMVVHDSDKGGAKRKRRR